MPEHPAPPDTAPVGLEFDLGLERDPLVRSSGLEQAWLSPDLFLGQKTPDAGRSAGLPGLESVLPRPALVKELQE